MSKARAYPSEAPFIVRKALSLPQKYYTWLEVSARDKHASLLHIIVNYRSKTFYNIGPRLRIHKTSYELQNHQSLG